MNEHMAGLTAKVPLREQCVMGQSRMEERNDGGCEERAAKDFVKFSAWTSRNGRWTNMWPTQPCSFLLESLSRDSALEIKTVMVCVSHCIRGLNCPFHYYIRFHIAQFTLYSHHLHHLGTLPRTHCLMSNCQHICCKALALHTISDPNHSMYKVLLNATGEHLMRQIGLRVSIGPVSMYLSGVH